MGPDWGNMGAVPKLQCFFLRETDEYSELCEQDAPMRGLPKGPASCHVLILRDAEEFLHFEFLRQGQTVNQTVYKVNCLKFVKLC